MKSFRTYITEGVATKRHAEGNFHTLKAPGNRTLVFSDTEMVGHVDFVPGTPEVLEGSRDRYITYINGSYRDSRLKLNRPVFRKVGEFSSQGEALAALQSAIADLRK